MTRTERRTCRLGLVGPDNIDLLVTMSPHSDQLTQFCFKTILSFVTGYCYSPPLGLSLTVVIILVIMLTQKIKQLLQIKVPSFYLADKEINALPWSQHLFPFKTFDFYLILITFSQALYASL